MNRFPPHLFVAIAESSRAQKLSRLCPVVFSRLRFSSLSSPSIVSSRPHRTPDPLLFSTLSCSRKRLVSTCSVLSRPSSSIVFPFFVRVVSVNVEPSNGGSLSFWVYCVRTRPRCPSSLSLTIFLHPFVFVLDL